MEDLFPNVLDSARVKIPKLWNFLSGDPIVLQSFLPCFDHIFTTGFSTQVWQSVIEKLAKKGLWHVSKRRGLSCGKSIFLVKWILSACIGEGIVIYYPFILMPK